VARMGEERKVYRVLMRTPEEKRPLGKLMRRWKIGLEWILGRLASWCGTDSPGSDQGPVAGSLKCGDEPSGSGATELVCSEGVHLNFRVQDTTVRFATRGSTANFMNKKLITLTHNTHRQG
jgi:hypothetical protein